MSNTIMFDIPPMSYARMTYGGRFNKQYKKYYAYKKYIQTQMQAEKFKPTNSLSMVFFVPMPPSWSKKKKDKMINKPHQSKPDLDNFIKPILDAFYYEKGGDATVYEISARKVWSMRGWFVVTTMPE